MAKSTSPQEDSRRSEVTPDKVSKTHGGTLVEAVSVEDLESFNDADCKHERLLRDESETEFIAFTCANPKCNEVVLFDKEVK